MGYTTKFQGRFNLSKIPSAETLLKLMAVNQELGRAVSPNAPDSYCQWELTKDGVGLQWDHSEKFYKYEEWLQFIHDEYLKPDGIELSGSVKFQGEDTDDCGVLEFKYGKVHKTTLPLVMDEVAELRQFRDFVLQHDDADEIKRDWAEMKRRAA